MVRWPIRPAPPIEYRLTEWPMAAPVRTDLGDWPKWARVWADATNLLRADAALFGGWRDYAAHFGILANEWEWGAGITYRDGEEFDKPAPKSSAYIRHSWGELGSIIQHVNPDDGRERDKNEVVWDEPVDEFPYAATAEHATWRDDASSRWQRRKAKQAAQQVVAVGPLPPGVDQHGLGYRQRISLFGKRIESPTFATPAEAAAWGVAARELRDRVKAHVRAGNVHHDKEWWRTIVLSEMGASTYK